MAAPKTLLCCWFVLLSAPLMQAGENEPVLLRYRFTPGQVVQYDDTLEDKYEIRIGGAKETPYSTKASRKSYRVESVNPDGSAVLVLTIESLHLEIAENDHIYKYDSRQPENADPEFATMPSLTQTIGSVGKPHLKVTITPLGIVTQMESLVVQATTPSDEEQPPALELSQSAREVLPALPEQAIPIGGTWTENFDVMIPIPKSKLTKPVKMLRQFTLRSVENGIATIDTRTAVLTVINDPDDEVLLIRRTPKGTIVIDLNQGLFTSRTLTQDNQVTGFGNGPSVMSVQQTQVEKIVTAQTAANDNSPLR